MPYIKHYNIFLLFLTIVVSAAPEAITLDAINALIKEKEYKSAIQGCHILLSFNPDNHEARSLLGSAYAAQNNVTQAYLQWEHILKRCPDNKTLRTKLADLYAEQEDFKLALAHYTHLTTQEPTNANALFRAASIHLKIGNIEQALHLFNSVVKIVHNSIAALYNIGYTLKVAGRIDEAISYYDKVIALKPDYDGAYLARGFALLNKGDFINGWTQHERYLKSANKNADLLRTLIKTNTLNGKHIVLTYEGGLGDTLMFIRYVEKLKNMGAYITCVIQKQLIQLLSNHPSIDELRTLEQGYPKSYDAHATLMTLPAVFYDTEETMPRSIPYIYPNQTLVQSWKNQCIPNKKLHIGLCWQTDVHNDVSRLPIARRGMPLALWHTLLKNNDISVYSLQRFDGVEQIKDIPSECTLYVYPEMDTKNGSFVDTAALISNLDLIISTDTSVAHLAGALGKPVLLLLPYSVDWRWIYGRTDSPWYPSMRIFKQQKPFDWEHVVDEVQAYLENHYGVSIT